MITACNCRLIVLDNLRYIRPWLSDALCRISTGGGYATRKLYQDAEEQLFSAMRPVILNGIEDLATRGDLLDRAICVSLPAIPDAARKAEAAFWRDFEKTCPRILGALLTALSNTLRELPVVEEQPVPRMADFARLGIAVEKAIGLRAGSFMKAYRGNREAATDLAIESSPIGQPIHRLIAKERQWRGTATKLLRDLASHCSDGPKAQSRRDWPKTCAAMSNALRRVIPYLRRNGIEVSFHRQGKERTRIILIEKAARTSSAPSAASAKSRQARKPAKKQPSRRTTADDGRTAGGQVCPDTSVPAVLPAQCSPNVADEADRADGQIGDSLQVGTANDEPQSATDVGPTDRDTDEKEGSG